MRNYIRFLSFRLSQFVSATRVTSREGIVLDSGVRAIETPPRDTLGNTGSTILATLGVGPLIVGRFVKHG